jgi:hypothetical protein
MSEHDERQQVPGTGLEISPQAQAVAGFTFGTLALTGQGLWTQTVQALWGVGFPQSRVESVLASANTASLLMALAGLLLCRRAVRAAPTDRWDQHLAQAGQLVGLVAVCLAALAVLTGLVHGVGGL